MSVTIVEAYREALASEMRTNDAIFVLGEDVRGGGAFEASLGLLDEFGPGRIVDAPISEAAIMGVAIGSAIRGLRPVVDFQYGDFLFAAADQLVQHATKLPEMSGDQLRVPLVLQLPTGASGRGAQHAHSVEASFFGTPGLVIATPSTPEDAAGLLRSALRHDGVVLLCIHKHLYGASGRPLLHPETSTGGRPPGDDAVPFGRAAIRRHGRDVTVVANLLMVHRALAVAAELARDGIDMEVVDPRTIAPLDVEAVTRSVARTRALLVVEEGPRMAGWGGYLIAELAAAGALEGIRVDRLAGRDAPIPYAPALEAAAIPSLSDIAAAARRLVA
jgi:acetoin:2,6-dichlorophenolindophenol oxidoreductase subunit beta